MASCVRWRASVASCQNQRHAGAADGFAVQGSGIQMNQARTRIADIKLVARHPFASGFIEPGQLRPIQFGQHLLHGFSLSGGRVEAQQAGDSLVYVEDPAGLIGHQDAVLDGIKERFQEGPFAGQALDHGLQPFGIETPDAFEYAIKKTGLRSGHDYSTSEEPTWLPEKPPRPGGRVRPAGVCSPAGGAFPNTKRIRTISFANQPR